MKMYKKVFLLLFIVMTYSAANYAQSLIKIIDSVKVDTEPRLAFPGGLEGYFNQRIRIPIEGIKDGIEGTVIVSALINAEGHLIDPRVGCCLGGEFIGEAFRLMKECPYWRPATINGKAIEVRVEIEIPFYYKKYFQK